MIRSGRVNPAAWIASDALLASLDGSNSWGIHAGLHAKILRFATSGVSAHFSSSPSTTSTTSSLSTSSSPSTSSPTSSGTVPMNSLVHANSLRVPLQHATQTPAKYTPWTPTRQLLKKFHLRRRMGFLMNTLEEEVVQAVKQQREFPNFQAGDILEVTVVVPESQRKKYVYKGVCIARYNKGIRTSFKLYNVFPESGGFVQHLPLYMPDIVKIEVVGRVPARRRKLYHLLEGQSSASSFQANVRPSA